MFLSSNKFLTFEFKKILLFLECSCFCVELLKSRKNSGTLLLPNQVISWKDHFGGSHRCTVEFLFWETTWNFYCRRKIYRGFFRVCHVLVLVLVLVGENRLPGHFLFLLFETTGQMLQLFQLRCVRKWRSKTVTPHLLRSALPSLFILPGFSLYCLAKIQRRILLGDTEFIVVVVF